MNAFMIALQFLTRFPVTLKQYPEEEVAGSLYWYGLVGALLGAFLYCASLFLNWVAPGLSLAVMAALLVFAWVFITGALHLDGLADSADAWLGGNDKEKVLAIMKDPRSGPAGVVSIACVLLLKFACLQTLLEHHALYLIVVPALARSAMPLLFLTTTYVRQHGLGSPFQGNVSPGKTLWQLGAILFLGFLITGPVLVLVIALAAITLIYLRASMRTKIGGVTGDTAGAAIEILEAVLLLGLVAWG
ncbi:MAG: adenosylcobinamide-GDP ribazoletransferase [Ketobacter sp.]